MAKKKVMDLLLENTIALQKTLTNLASELKVLNKRVSELFELLEAASAAFKERKVEEKQIPSDIEEKLDKIIEQNKTLAKGLLLLEKTIREKEEMKTFPGPIRPLRTKPLRKKPLEEESEETEEEKTEEEYKPQPLPEFSF